MKNFALEQDGKQKTENKSPLGISSFGTWGWIRKSFVLVVGSCVTLVGIVMLVTPGPGLLVIPAGLAILAVEFEWAQRLLHKCKDYITRKKR